MIVQDEGVVLTARDFSESSQILVLWTEGHGRVTGIAKGVRRAGRSAFDGPFEPSARYEVGFYPRARGEGLAVLSESSLRERYPAVRDTLEGWWAFSESAEAVLALTQEMDAHPGLLDALGTLLGDPSRPGALSTFLMRLLEATGHAPALTSCAGCGRPLPAGGRVSFAFWVGGVVCPPCVRGPSVSLPAPLRAALRAAAGGGDFPAASRRPAEALLARYAAHTAGGALEASRCRERSRRALQRLRAS